MSRGAIGSSGAWARARIWAPSESGAGAPSKYAATSWRATTTSTTPGQARTAWTMARAERSGRVNRIARSPSGVQSAMQRLVDGGGDRERAGGVGVQADRIDARHQRTGLGRGLGGFG